MKSVFASTGIKSCLLFMVSSSFLMISACKPAATPVEEGTGDLTGLVLENIPGTPLQYARQIDTTGRLQIQGFVDGGKKAGQWIEYSPEGDILRINHFVNGLLEGTALRMGFRNQVDLRLNYRQNQLDGPWTSYKFGKVIEKRNYNAGKLEGTVYTYDDRTFKLKQEVEYKNGLQDGYFKYYDEEGNLSLEYLYKKGEKVSGGIVEKK